MAQKRNESGSPPVTAKSGQSQQRINEQIRSPQIRLISEQSEQLGVMSAVEALSRARIAGLDLVEVAPEAKPPVCRIMDYGKFKYEQKKRVAKQQSGRTQTQLKELRFRPKTGEHDIQVKVNKAREFLAKKDKVLLTVIFRGREAAHISEGEKLITAILTLLEDVAKVESPPKTVGKKIMCTVAAK